MTTKTRSLPEALHRHLSSHGATASLASYLDQGAELVTAEAITVLRQQQASLHAKITALAESERLRSRIELLASVLAEASADGKEAPPAQREIAFALLYFLKGADRIPDSVPEIGLLDDAMIIQLVLQRQGATIRAYCRRHGIATPAELE
ncbi:MAG: DUF1232 domain-containing protein [Opitutaceae bacterium]|nr:DUF1232 domain-containing protein [Opitutaceae bacterium]